MGEADYESLPTDNLWQHLCAGGMAGMMEHCFMYPVDCVKVSTLQAHYLSLSHSFCNYGFMYVLHNYCMF